MKAIVYKFGQEQLQMDFSTEILGAENDEVKFLMGRSPQCHLVLDDQMISRELAEIIYSGNAWKIKKISDKGDVFVNGQNILEQNLNNGDVIKSGDFSINIELDQNEVSSNSDTNFPSDDSSLDDNQDFPEESDGLEALENNNQDEFLANTETQSNNFESTPESDAENYDQADQYSNYDEEYDENYDANEYDQGEYGDQGYDNSSYSLEALDDEKTGIVTSFAVYQLELFGENAPYDTFNLEDGETFIGRNPEKCQIVLSDPEVSSVHAVVKKSGAICILEDQQSGNGTIYNGERINRLELSNGDEFIIGGTTFTLRVGSEFLNKEKETFMPVAENQEIEVEEIVEVDPNLEDGFEVGGEAGSSGGSLFEQIKNDPEKRKKAIYALVGVVMIWFMMDDSPPPPPKNIKKTDQEKKTQAQKEKEAQDPFSKLTKEQQSKVENLYLLAKEMNDLGNYTDALDHLTELHKIVPYRKNSKQLEDVAKSALAEIAEKERKKQEEIQRQLKMARVKELVDKAKEAVKERNVMVAEKIFAQVSEMDPNNFDIPLLKSEIDAWKKEEERKKIEAAQAKAERERMVSSLKPGKNQYLKKNWYQAVLELEKFLEIKEMDDDLVQEGTKLLEESRANLSQLVNPILGKARSLVEGQDLKGAYEEYKKVLKHEPSNTEALNEINRIKDILVTRSRKIYREAIVSESLSLFSQAKEKYQELQQVAPSDSEYYKKATEKLKEYIE